MQYFCFKTNPLAFNLFRQTQYQRTKVQKKMDMCKGSEEYLQKKIDLSISGDG